MEPIQPLLARTVAALVRPAPMSPEKLLFAWRAAVGPAVARATKVRITPERALEVHPDDDRWCGEIERSAAVIVARLQEMLGSEHVDRLLVHRRTPKKQAGRRSWARKPAARRDAGDVT